MGLKSLLRDALFLYIAYNMIVSYPLPVFKQVLYAIIIAGFVLYFGIERIKDFK
jgi:hypothetical protein